MPLYQYKCDRCGTETEDIEKFDAPKEKPCSEEKCEGTAKRQLGVSNFQLSGGGWSKDGYS